MPFYGATATPPSPYVCSFTTARETLPIHHIMWPSHVSALSMQMEPSTRPSGAASGRQASERWACSW